jgi:hypothetical protein
MQSTRRAAHSISLACFSVYGGGNGHDKLRGVLVDAGRCNYGISPRTWTFCSTNNQTHVLLTR